MWRRATGIPIVVAIFCCDSDMGGCGSLWSLLVFGLWSLVFGCFGVERSSLWRKTKDQRPKTNRGLAGALLQSRVPGVGRPHVRDVRVVPHPAEVRLAVGQARR